MLLLNNRLDFKLLKTTSSRIAPLPTYRGRRCLTINASRRPRGSRKPTKVKRISLFGADIQMDDEATIPALVGGLGVAMALVLLIGPLAIGGAILAATAMVAISSGAFMLLFALLPLLMLLGIGASFGGIAIGIAGLSIGLLLSKLAVMAAIVGGGVWLLRGRLSQSVQDVEEDVQETEAERAQREAEEEAKRIKDELKEFDQLLGTPGRLRSREPRE